MSRKKRTFTESMLLFYKKEDNRLYGQIFFYKHDNQNRETASEPCRQSLPFIIGRYASSGNLEVIGSVEFLLKEIRRLIDGYIESNSNWGNARRRLKNSDEIKECDARYDHDVMDFVILVSTHTRNLFHLMTRLNKKTIPKRNYHNVPDGKVELSELFNTLIHNRYYYFDGTCVKDVFSDRFNKKSALSRHFMGYGFDIMDFINAIEEILYEVQIKDLTQLLTWKFQRLSASSDPQDVVFLIQNLCSFSELMKLKVTTEKYGSMLELMFINSESWNSGVKLSDGTIRQTQNVLFHPPDIQIDPNIGKKEFKIRVRCTKEANYEDLNKENLQDSEINIGFRAFFEKVNAAFGEDKILEGMRRRGKFVPVDSPPGTAK